MDSSDPRSPVSFAPGDLLDDLPDALGAFVDGLSPPQPQPRDISAVIISSFQSRFEKLPDATFTVATWLDAIRDGQVADPIAQIRASRGTTHYDRLKKGLRCVAWAGQFPSGRKQTDPFEPSGLVFLELDFHDGAPPEGWLWAEKQRLASNPGVVAVYLSPGGQGLHIVAAAAPAPSTPSEYRQAWAWLTRELAIEERGDPQVKHPGRLAAVSHDAGLYQNLEPTPIRWEPNTFANAGRSAESSRRYSPADVAEALRLVAQHFGVAWDGATEDDAKAGLRMACPYHGGDNPSSLRVWQGEQEVTNKKGEVKIFPKMHARCHSRECPSAITLRFLAREVGFEWPITFGIYWKASEENALADTLALLRLDMRLNRTSGQIEVRPWPGFAPDRILAESCVPFRKTGWADIGGTTFDRAIKILAKSSFALEGTAGDWDDSFIVGASKSPYTCFPFVEYLESLPRWDGTHRLYSLFAKALGALDTDLNRFASTGFMVGAVMRSVEPGCVMTGCRFWSVSRAWASRDFAVTCSPRSSSCPCTLRT